MYDLLQLKAQEEELKYAKERKESLLDFNKLDKIKLELDEQIIVLQSSLDYKIPEDKRKILGDVLYNEFSYYLNMIIEMNNKNISKNIFDVRVTLNLDKDVIYIKDKLVDIAKKYCKNRINKPNSKDKTNFDKCIRLTLEIAPFILTLLTSKNNLNMFFLEDMLNYITWCFADRLMGGSINTASIEKKTLYKLINQSKDIEQLLFDVGYKIINNIDEIKIELQNLCDLMIEMKKYILYEDSISISVLNTKLEVSWCWEFTNNYIGKLIIEGSNSVINVNSKGYLICESDSIYNIQNIYDDLKDVKYFQINLLILRTVYECMFSLFEKIDVNAFENEILLKDLITEEVNDSKLVIEPIKYSKTTLKQYNIKENTSWQKFIKILKENFSVAVEQGKGDDIKIFIKNNSSIDSKIYRTSDIATKKREILIKTQENILKKIGISAYEWSKIINN